MTELTIRTFAVELAGKFYESNRSPQFRAAFPTWEHYRGGWQIVGEGRAKKVPPGWMHHVVLARRLLAEMLKQPDARISPVMKDRIAEALIEDHGKAKAFGKKVHQRMERHDDGKPSDQVVAGLGC